MRSMVEGRALARVAGNRNYNTVEIAKNFDRRDSQRRDAVGRQPSIPSRVSRRAISMAMALPVHFDAQLRRVTIEVQRIRTRRMLLSPFMPHSVLSKLFPKQDFRKAELPTVLARLAVGLSISLQHFAGPVSRCARPSTMLRMVPLPETSSGRI